MLQIVLIAFVAVAFALDCSPWRCFRLTLLKIGRNDHVANDALCIGWLSIFHISSVRTNKYDGRMHADQRPFFSHALAC